MTSRARTRAALAIAVAIAASVACRSERTSTPPAIEHDASAREPGATTESDSSGASVSSSPSLAAVRPPRTIFRTELDRALARGPAWLLGQLEPDPVRQDGRFVGWRIGAVFPDAPDLCPPGCDLVPGDVILSVQGDPLATPQALDALIARLDALETLEVERVRAGTRERIVYSLVEAP